MPTNFSAIFRKIKMLRMIPREPGKITASDLTERLNEQGFEVGLRTIQRDLIKLSSEFPFTCKGTETTKIKEWYFIKDAFLFDIPEFSPLSAFSFNLVETLLHPILPREISDQLNPHFRSVKSFLSKLQGASWAKWSEKVRIVPRYQHLVPAQIRPDVLDTVYEALWREQQFEAAYKPKEAENTGEYIVNPLGLVFRQEVVFLVCTLWKYEDVKQLALHRFKSAKLLESTRLVPEEFDLDNYIHEKHFAYPLNNEMISIKLMLNWEAAIHLSETPLSKDQKLTEEDDGRVLLEATVQETSELHWWLLGFGDFIEVLEPAKLRNEFRKQIKNMAQMYF